MRDGVERRKERREREEGGGNLSSRWRKGKEKNLPLITITGERESDREGVRERTGRGGKERMNLPLLRELCAHVARVGGESMEERERGRGRKRGNVGERENDRKREGPRVRGRAIMREKITQR